MKIFKTLMGCYLPFQTLLLSTSSHAQNLDFGDQDPIKVVSPESLFPYARLTLVFFSIYIGLGLLLLPLLSFLKNKICKQ